MRQKTVRVRSGGIRLAALVWVFGSLAAFAPEGGAQELFLRGDLNQDGAVSITDAVYIRKVLFDAIPVACMNAADVDDSGMIDLSDEIYLLNALFRMGAAPAPPFPEPGLDPTPDDLSCRSYEAHPPAQAADDVIRVGDVVAVPGEEIRVPVYLTNSVAVDAVQLVMETDLAIFAPAWDGTALDFTGTAIEEFIGEPDWAEVTTLWEDRAFVIGICFGVDWSIDVLPASAEERLLLNIRGRVSDQLQGDAVIRIQPTNGPEGQGTGHYEFRNELCSHSGKDGGYQSFLPQRLIGGALEVKAEFRRGDTNADGRLDISDAVRMIQDLFGDGPGSSCPDASDSNDDEAVDIADAVFILQYLFARGPALPAPYPSCGVDPTPNPDPAGPCLPPCTYESSRCPG